MSLRSFRSLVLVGALAGFGCGDDTTTTPDAASMIDAAPMPDSANTSDAGGPQVPATYVYDSRFTPGTSSVAYSGQTFRQVLIADMSAYIEALTMAIDSGMSPVDGDILAALNFYYQFDVTTGGGVDILLSTMPASVQGVYMDISASGANLKSKVAGGEAMYDHQDWATAFTGWGGDGGGGSPDALVQYWLGQLDDMAVARGLGVIPTDPGGNSITKVYVTATGLDLKQLLQKFLLMSITYSQGTDKYLDSATAGAGLLAPNTQDTDKPYTKLEHAWDEGFGYFGAARGYNLHTDAENASPGYFDANNDGAIDLKAELNYGASVNAAKRDLGADPTGPTDFSKAAMDAFLHGRAIIAAAGDELTAGELAELEALRDAAVANWEMAIGATVIHYINEVLADMGEFGTPAYNFLDHAKHWSEGKGFALGLQFNPRAYVGGATAAQLNTLLRDKPVLPSAPQAEIDAYVVDLLAARALLQTAYAFPQATVEGW